jgi:hypothetical protein
MTLHLECHVDVSSKVAQWCESSDRLQLNFAAILGVFTMVNVDEPFPTDSENLQASPVLSFGLGKGVRF